MQADRPPEVFISYAREDANYARRLWASLRASGAKPWLDVEDLLPGQNWEAEIEKAVRRADFVIALLSSQSLEKRGFIQKELRFVISVLDEIPEGRVFLIPARLDDCRPQHKRLQELNWVDLFPDFDTGFRKVLRVVRPPRLARAGVLDPAFVADEHDLAQAGWGVIFHRDADPAVRQALAPLLELRRARAAERDGQLYREFAGPAGYAPDETALRFLMRHGMGPGTPDPRRVPSYLLIVGDPAVIPFEFQYDLGVQYRVGRLAFPHVESYAHYAQSVIDAESRLPEAGAVTLFNPTHGTDRPAALALKQLTLPVSESLARQLPAWKFDLVTGEQATKKALCGLLSSRRDSHLLFVAAHGMNFRAGDERRAQQEGSVVCAEWTAGKMPDDDSLFGAGDVDPSWDLRGSLLWLWVESGAGNSGKDDFSSTADEPAAAEGPPFLSALCQRLLGRENGALAVIGHVDRAWATAFTWPGAGPQSQMFESAIRVILEGQPVGGALRFFSAKYSELAALQMRQQPTRNLWTAMIDARNNILLGDPAVRMAAPARAGL